MKKKVGCQMKLGLASQFGKKQWTSYRPIKRSTFNKSQTIYIYSLFIFISDSPRVSSIKH